MARFGQELVDLVSGHPRHGGHSARGGLGSSCAASRVPSWDVSQWFVLDAPEVRVLVMDRTRRGLVAVTVLLVGAALVSCGGSSSGAGSSKAEEEITASGPDSPDCHVRNHLAAE